MAYFPDDDCPDSATPVPASNDSEEEIAEADENKPKPPFYSLKSEHGVFTWGMVAAVIFLIITYYLDI